ncbi:MAG: hypothetical protein AB1646_18365 [Thermodesulfobacteriota bacterium]
MNTVAGTTERRTIKVKDFLDDYHCAVGDLELMQKYNLSVRGLDKFVQLLVDRRILSSDEVALRNEKAAFARSHTTNPETEHSAFMCPSCLITWPEMFDVCPNCGIVVQEYMAHPPMESEPPADTPEMSEQPASDRRETIDSQPQTSCEVSSSQESQAGQGWAVTEYSHTLGGSAGTSMEPYVSAPRVTEAENGRDSGSACSGTCHPDDESSLGDKESRPLSTDQGPIEIPLFENLSERAPQTEARSAPKRSRLRQAFVWAEKVRHPAPGEAESDEDLIPGTPICGDVDGLEPLVRMQTWCSSCASPMEPDLRRVYDRSGTRASFMLSAVFLLLGFVGAFTLTLFNGYSFARLLVVYGTGMLLMCAGVCLTAGFLMHMAKERVFRCPNCGRVCPRA